MEELIPIATERENGFMSCEQFRSKQIIKPEVNLDSILVDGMYIITAGGAEFPEGALLVVFYGPNDYCIQQAFGLSLSFLKMRVKRSHSVTFSAWKTIQMK